MYQKFAAEQILSDKCSCHLVQINAPLPNDWQAIPVRSSSSFSMSSMRHQSAGSAIDTTARSIQLAKVPPAQVAHTASLKKKG